MPLRTPTGTATSRSSELPELLRDEIEQFFSIYKELENKAVEVGGWRSRDDALAEIAASQQRFRQRA